MRLPVGSPERRWAHIQGSRGHVNLEAITDDELGAEARRRGFELHSVRFSQAAQNALRELEGLRRRIDELVMRLRDSSNIS
jgi:hypothetical protein